MVQCAVCQDQRRKRSRYLTIYSSLWFIGKVLLLFLMFSLLPQGSTHMDVHFFCFMCAPAVWTGRHLDDSVCRIPCAIYIWTIALLQTLCKNIDVHRWTTPGTHNRLSWNYKSYLISFSKKEKIFQLHTYNWTCLQNMNADHSLFLCLYLTNCYFKSKIFRACWSGKKHWKLTKDNIFFFFKLKQIFSIQSEVSIYLTFLEVCIQTV